MTLPPITRRLMIHGRVQGVGFRWSLYAEANALKVLGWVRNRQDGSVEALLHGPPDAVDALTVWAHHGPPSARVDYVTVRDDPSPESLDPSGFRQRPTF